MSLDTTKLIPREAGQRVMTRENMEVEGNKMFVRLFGATPFQVPGYVGFLNVIGVPISTWQSRSMTLDEVAEILQKNKLTRTKRQALTEAKYLMHEDQENPSLTFDTGTGLSYFFYEYGIDRVRKEPLYVLKSKID